MPLDDDDRKVVEELYKAMQAGPAGESAIMGLFADDAVLVEPFTGQPQTHSGKPAIRAALATMWQGRAPTWSSRSRGSTWKATQSAPSGRARRPSSRARCAAATA